MSAGRDFLFDYKFKNTFRILKIFERTILDLIIGRNM